MKYLLCYFQPKATKILVEKITDSGDKVLALSSNLNFVGKQEVVARPVSAESIEEARTMADPGMTPVSIEPNPGYKPAEGIYFDQFETCYRAAGYGFVVLDPVQQKIKLVEPIHYAKNKIHAYFLIVPTKQKSIPSYRDIEEVLLQKKVVTMLQKDLIEEQLAEINAMETRLHRILVARGKEPVHGYDEYFTPLLKFEKKAGKIMEDGRIDFRELDSIVEIKKGQSILQRHHKVKPEDGWDVFGDKVEALFEKKNGFIKGDNLVPSVDQADVFVSGIDGCLTVEGRKFIISPKVVIKGNVDFDSGNIDFNGSVQIQGSVLPGFTVRAKGDIIIEKNADDAYLEAGGDIIVKQGMAGRGNMKVVAGGMIKAKYLLNCEVEAVLEIQVEDSIINSRVFSNDKIVLTGKTGKIIGGELTARHEVVANVIGVPKENVTKINVGRSLFVEREIVGIRAEMEEIQGKIDEVMTKLKTSFGEGVFEDPKKFLAILPPIKRKSCIGLITELQSFNKVKKEIDLRRVEAEDKLKLEREPTVMVMDAVFPGTVLSIKKQMRKIDQKLDNVKFYIDQETKDIRYTAAV
jgi:uncharacterized protein